MGTKAAVKTLDSEDLRTCGQSAIFANAYHLLLRPGADVVAELGGLHRFMAWDGPIATDSGGFQVFSLGAAIEHGVGKVGGLFPGATPARRTQGGSALMQVEEDGVRFRSHLDGSRHRLTPELAIEVQRLLGADVMMAFDECTSPLHDRDYTAAAMERTHRWAVRCLEAFDAGGSVHGYPQALYGIVQGGAYHDLRLQSAAVLGGLPFQGMAIGGSLGATKAEMAAVLEWTVPELPPDRPRHLLGIGEIPDIFAAVERGIDTFDCVAPTRMARNAGLIARQLDDQRLPRLRMNLRNARYARDPRPVVDGCPCPLCARHSRAYLHHLFRERELLAYRLASLHNLTQLNALMTRIREAIEAGSLPDLRREWLGDEATVPEGQAPGSRQAGSPPR